MRTRTATWFECKIRYEVPFLGSGTTAVAAIKEHRHYIGFELNKEYFDIAQNRINEVLAQPTLF